MECGPVSLKDIPLSQPPRLNLETPTFNWMVATPSMVDYECTVSLRILFRVEFSIDHLVHLQYISYFVLAVQWWISPATDKVCRTLPMHTKELLQCSHCYAISSSLLCPITCHFWLEMAWGMAADMLHVWLSNLDVLCYCWSDCHLPHIRFA